MVNMDLKVLMFQSTYLYKVRRPQKRSLTWLQCFNPRTYIRYDAAVSTEGGYISSFNPRTYIRYDFGSSVLIKQIVVSIHVPI